MPYWHEGSKVHQERQSKSHQKLIFDSHALICTTTIQFFQWVIGRPIGPKPKVTRSDHKNRLRPWEVSWPCSLPYMLTSKNLSGGRHCKVLMGVKALGDPYFRCWEVLKTIKIFLREGVSTPTMPGKHVCILFLAILIVEFQGLWLLTVFSYHPLFSAALEIALRIT